MADDDGLEKTRWGNLRSDPLGRRPAPGTLEVNDPFALAGRAADAPVQDSGYVRHYDRGWESSREPAAEYFARVASAPDDPAVLRAEAANVAHQAVRALEAEHVKVAEREAAVARRLSDARAAAAALENGGPQ